MGNKYFKFFDIRLAETTTKTGREILFHMAKQIGKELDGQYTFPTNSVIYGDTDSCYFKTHTDNIQDAKIICEYIEESINNSFPEFMKSRFFCNEMNASRVHVENEIISDIGIFVKKKIYLLHLVYKDGYDTNEMKIMGHAIKKTTLTPVVKKALTDAITDYFKTHDWAGLNKNVVAFKHLLETSNKLEDYGIPKKVNKVESYTERFNSNEPNMTLPQGQGASIFWNICLEEYNDKESIPITSQMPIRIYYLDKKFGRFSSIAVPADLSLIPDWFKENFIPIIDKDKQITTMVDKTLTNICNAIGKQIPTEKAVLADEVLVF
jgi:DNA polymerase elongation subunit (family B)